MRSLFRCFMFSIFRLWGFQISVIGGNAIVGTNFLELKPIFREDPETRAIILFCEPGRVIEEHLAQTIKQEQVYKLIIAFTAGRFMDSMLGVRFGYAASIVEGDRGSAKGKIEALRFA